MKFGIWLMVVLTLFMLAGVLPVPGSDGLTIVFKTPAFIVLMGLLCLSAIGCCRRRLSWRRAGFLLTHLGVVVVLSGAFIGYTRGVKTNVVVPVSGHHEIDHVVLPNGKTNQLDFTLSCLEFSVEHYAPKYNVYRPADGGADAGGAGHPTYEFVEQLPVDDRATIQLGNGEAIPVSDLKLGEGGDEWVEQQLTPGGWVLQASRAVRHYHARVLFRDRGQDGREQQQDLAVNHPAEYRGWRFYLMDFDQMMQRYIWVSARHDPGRGIVITGIWMLIAGVAVLCWIELGGRKVRTG